MPADPLAAVVPPLTGAAQSRAMRAAISGPDPMRRLTDAVMDARQAGQAATHAAELDRHRQVIAASLAGGIIAASGAEPTPAYAVALWRDVLEELRR